MENQPKFGAKITPEQVRNAQAEDARKVANGGSPAKELGTKEVPPKASKRHKATTEQKNSESEQKEEPKAKIKKEKKAEKEPLTFPLTIRINAYGFIGLKKSVLSSLGWKKDMALSVVKNPDGSVTLRKA